MKRECSKYFSNKQEKRVADEICGRTVIASGSLWGCKGDVRTDDLLIECKTTSKSFYSLTSKTWDKINKEAKKDGARLPVMSIDIANRHHRFAVVDFFSFSPYLPCFGTALHDNPDEGINSIRIKSETKPMIVRLENPSKDRDSIPFILAIITWGEFLDILERGI